MIGLYEFQWSCGADRIIIDYQTFSCVSIGMIILWCLAIIGVFGVFRLIRTIIMHEELKK
jgi:hypothetical protein